MDHELKDYESERERNIERNKSFLSLLAVGQINTALIKSEEAVDTDGCAPGDVVVLEESSADFSRLCKAALASCKEQYPFRNKEAERIVSYIEQV